MFDFTKRVVSLDRLEQLCKEASSMCHRYEVTKVSKNYAYVCYNNPDEWGNSHPLTATFPVYKWNWDKIAVVLDISRVYGDKSPDQCGYESFHTLMEQR